MYRFLVPVGSNQSRAEKQAEYVIGLANAVEEVEVVLLHVFREVNAAEEAGNVDLAEYADAPAAYERAAELLADAGIAVKRRTDSGDPAEAILSAARDIDADGIVVGGRKRSPTGKALFGSVTQSVILNSDRPVTVTTGGER